MNHVAIQPSLARLLTWAGTLLVGLAVAACGGAGAGAGGAGASAATKAAALSVLTSESALDSDGSNSATITAVVKTAQNVALAGQAVTFSTDDPGATLQVVSSVTDASGRASATLSITDTTERNIVVTATSGTIVGTVTVPVVGNALSIIGSNNIVFNAPTDFSVSLRNSGGAPIPGKVVTITSAAGNTVSPATLTTDAQGQGTFTVTGTAAGADTLTATSQGVSTTFAATVSGTQIAYSSPALGAEIQVNTPTAVTVQMIQNGSPVSGETITFAATRGSFVGPNTAVTNGAGVATVQIQSTSSGMATLSATSSGGVTSTRAVEFVSTLHSKITLQPSPSVVGANTTTAGTNSSLLIAVVKDANDNPVKGVRVDFSLVSDPSNGRIEPAFGITDSFGTATSSFIAGPNPTGPGQVVTRAAVVAAPAISVDTTLTVSQLELSVEMGTGNQLFSEQEDTVYRMPWTVVVTDSSGNPVKQARVVVAIEPRRFRKGFWTIAGTAWETTITATCANEDTNLNRTLDAGEDVDGDNQLEPGGQAAAFVSSANGVTGDDGLAQVDVVYPQSAARWTEARMRVTITTASGGTEGDAESTFWLPIAAEDVVDTSKSPPGANSPDGPYGTVGNCADPN